MLKLASGMSRLGTESAFEVLARAKALEAKGKHIINLGIGQPDFQTPAHIVEAACKALRDGHHGYTPGQRHSPGCARRWPPTSTSDTASRSTRAMSSSCPAARSPCSSPS